ncbi:MAG: MFS transporter [Acidimicrobiales bacterium]|nr:MFS transporter [Acidimicrobiales bacterium]
MSTIDAATTDQRRNRDSLESVPARAWLALATVAAAFMLTSINVTGTNIAFPSIEQTFSSTPRTTLAWALSGYSIVLASFMVMGGRLADQLGRRKVFTTGVLIFLVVSLLCAAAPVAAAFIAGRVIQGFGGALLVPSSLALVLPEFPASRRTSAVATWAASGSVGAAVAPSLSAVIVDLTSWRVVYLLAVPVVVVVLVAGGRLLPHSQPAATVSRLDLVGIPMGTAAIGLLALGIIEGPSWGWASPRIVGVFAAVAVLAPLFVLRSLRHPAPLLNLRIFKVRTVWSANLANVFMSMMGLSIWLVWPLFLTQVWGYSLLKAGLAITPGPMCSAAVGITAGRLADRHGPRVLISIGSVFPILSMLWMVWRFGPEPHYVSTFLPATILFSLGFGFTFSPLNGAALRGVDASAFGEVNATFNTVRNLGGGLGVAIVVALLGNDRPIPFDRFDHTFFAMAFLGIVPVIVIGLFYPRGAQDPS